MCDTLSKDNMTRISVKKKKKLRYQYFNVLLSVKCFLFFLKKDLKANLDPEHVRICTAPSFEY